MRVFARQGFHTCRVSDIADEAGVAYGLVYHYFQSKEQVLDTLFLERWDVLLEAIADVDNRRGAARDKLDAVAGFIVDSYRHDPELMKVIIVEVTRAANSFGAHAPGEDPRGVRPASPTSCASAQRDGAFRDRRRRRVRGAWRSTARSSRCSPAGSSACCRRATTTSRRPSVRIVDTICGGLDAAPPRRVLDSAATMSDNDMVKRLVWSGMLAGVGALASMVTTRVAAVLYRRIFDEDPPE